jgi:hypothetical protein
LPKNSHLLWSGFVDADHVAGKQLAPFAHALVRRDQDRATAVAIGHQPKEQAGLMPRHRLEAELVDHPGSVSGNAPSNGRSASQISHTVAPVARQRRRRAPRSFR